MMVTVIMGGSEANLPGAKGADGALWVPAAELPAALGWELKPEGLCRDEVCVPLPREAPERFARDGQVNLAAFWEAMGAPALHDAAGETWVLGESAGDRAARMATLEAPDFALPDLAGKLHRLSEQRGRRVLLATWASW